MTPEKGAFPLFRSMKFPIFALGFPTLPIVVYFRFYFRMKPLAENIDLLNPEFLQAWNLLRNTSRSVFLTGKAGSGKSTFLRYIVDHIRKPHVVLAPTGIAATNVRGMTLHSFFQIPLRPVPPDDPDYSLSRIGRKVKLTREKVQLLRKLELIVIDEISMVRADIIDFIDRLLRNVRGRRHEPFGGCQMLLVGDIFQLEPVVTPDTRTILGHYYRNYFFFNALVYSQMELVAIELKKIYRQSDKVFTSLLDRLRVNRATAADLATINSRVDRTVADFCSEDGFTMTLAARRDTVDTINERAMAALEGEEYTFDGEISEDFPDKQLPTDKKLLLKKGAQVVLLRNDPERRWVNGTIARIHAIEPKHLRIELADGSIHELERTVWENVRYSFNEETRRVKEDVVGTFTQYPVKAAWAMTIHKSQGLTFDKVIVDLEGGAFSSGQTYVALSRCTSLEGMTLTCGVGHRDIIVNSEIVDFSRRFNSVSAVEGALNEARADMLFGQAIRAADCGDFTTAMDDFYKGLTYRNILASPLMRRYIARRLGVIERQRRVIERYEDERRSLATEYVDMGGECLAAGDLWEPALANFDKALRLDSGNSDAKLGRSRALMVKGDTDAALTQLASLLLEKPDNAEAHILAGECLTRRHDYEHAVKHYRKAARHDKRNPSVYDALADLCEKLDLIDEADRYRNKATRLRNKGKK